MDNAKANMRYFVKLVASIGNKVIENALRELSVATYENALKQMWEHNEEAEVKYQAIKNNIMAILYPTAIAA